jgi:hypothetical protein
MTGEIDNPTMFSDGSRSYLFWIDKHKVPLGEVYYTGFDSIKRKGRITGKTLYPSPKRAPKCPSAVFDNNGNLHLAWASFFGSESIVHYGAINPAGDILKEKMDLTSKVGRFKNPIISRTQSGLLHIFWFDKPKDKKEHATIYLKTSKDNGLTWEKRESQTEDIRN